MESLKTSFLVKSILNRCSQSQADLLGVHTNDGKQYLNSYNFIPYETLQSWQKTPMPRSMANPMRVLAIAHTDCVPKYVKPVYDNKQFRIISGQLDDRLGVAILLDIIPQFMPWLQMDVLLTDDEEIGKSTAADWVKDLQACNMLEDTKAAYDWVFSFDRAGTDAVTYSYHNTVATKILKDSGWEHGIGSFSDICYVEDLGLWGCNFGCGYYGQHSNNCHVDLDVLRANLFRFRCFVNKAESKGKLLDTPAPRSKWDYGYSDSNWNYDSKSYRSTYYYDMKDDTDYVTGGHDITDPYDDYQLEDTKIWPTDDPSSQEDGSMPTSELVDDYTRWASIDFIQENAPDSDGWFLPGEIDAIYAEGIALYEMVEALCKLSTTELMNYIDWIEEDLVRSKDSLEAMYPNQGVGSSKFLKAFYDEAIECLLMVGDSVISGSEANKLVKILEKRQLLLDV